MDYTPHSTMILNIFKIGGSLVDDRVQRAAFIRNLSRLKSPAIIVHGGGHSGSEMCRKLGIPVNMSHGRRITDKETLKVVTMVYAGWINKSLVADLQAAGMNSIGLSGADANIIEAHKRTGTEIDYGFAGDIDRINARFILNLLDDGVTAVIAPITHDQKGQLLNTNADTIAAAIASAVAQARTVRLVYVLDRKGVLADPDDLDSVIETLKISDIEQLRRDNIISEGMIPKLHNAKAALEGGADAVFLTNVDGMESLGTCGTSILME